MGSEFLSKLPPAFSSIMTASKCMTRSIEEDRYNTIGDASAAGSAIIGNLCVEGSHRNDILFVVYTERELAEAESFFEQFYRKAAPLCTVTVAIT